MKRDLRCKLTVAQEKAAARRYALGSNIKAIAAELGVGAWCIREAARRHGAVIRDRGGRARDYTKSELRDIASRWRQGESQTAIASAHGTHQVIVSRLLRQAGLTPEIRRPRGPTHGSWKGGRVVLGSGYIGVMLDSTDPMASMRHRMGYVLEHRLVMARKLGRPLTSKETVHHINGDRSDNRLRNLQLRNGRHGKGTVLRCADCGSHNIEHAPIAAKD